MGAREPLLRSRDCPPELRPRNCSATVKAAEQFGWKWECKIAIGWPDDVCEEAIRSVVLNLARDGVFVTACWAGSSDGSDMGFDGAWIVKGWHRLNYTALGHLVKGTEPVPTPKEQAALQVELMTMLDAIKTLRPIAELIAVLPEGTKARSCKGKVAVNAVGLPFLPCSNTTAPDEPLCRTGCTSGLLFDGTVEPKKASKPKTTKENTGDLT